MPINSVCARCGRPVDLRRADTAKVPRQLIPDDYRLEFDDDLGTLVALFCPSCWPPRLP